MSSDHNPITFKHLQLMPNVLKALDAVGYEAPTPIQAASIPPLLEGKDLVGQAQTGTGKTAAFALPLLSRIDTELRKVQLLVLTPTRELAIQVAEAFQSYARFMKGFHVLPIYGGQGYSHQLSQLKRGIQVVVGTPGRVMDHMRQGTLKLSDLRALVLDEADEMLSMGFIDDVNWILEKTPPERQVALFSATMPPAIIRVAKQHLNEPVEAKIQIRSSPATTINQRYLQLHGDHKLDALTRILEVEEFTAMLIFVRTRMATEELAQKLEARGYASAALNGDIQQKIRERTVDALKQGKIEILVATDVAARGLDVDRISHVVNYDISYDTEAYIHRIGRTGRAGRQGEAILFVTYRERRLLRAIEKAIGKPINAMDLPSSDDVNDRRIERFKQQISDTLAVGKLDFFYQLIEQYQQEHSSSTLEIAAALAQLLQGDRPFLLEDRPKLRVQRKNGSGYDASNKGSNERGRYKADGAGSNSKRGKPGFDAADFRVEVGHIHGVKPGNILGAIANEAEIERQYIGHIRIFDDYSTVELPKAIDRQVLQLLQKVWVCQQQLKISRLGKSSADFQRKPKTKKLEGTKAVSKPGKSDKAASKKEKRKKEKK